MKHLVLLNSPHVLSLKTLKPKGPSAPVWERSDPTYLALPWAQFFHARKVSSLRLLPHRHWGL